MPFVSDTFTDTDGVLLTSHTGEVGATWTIHASNDVGGSFVFNGNRLPTRVNTTHLPSGTPASSEYDVSADITTLGTTTTQIARVLGRVNTANREAYIASRMAAEIRLIRMSSSASQVNLGSYILDQVNGQTESIKLEIRNATKKVYRNGVEILSSTDNVIAATGVVGISGSGTEHSTSATGKHIDNFVAENFPPPSAGLTFWSFSRIVE